MMSKRALVTDDCWRFGASLFLPQEEIYRSHLGCQALAVNGHLNLAAFASTRVTPDHSLVPLEKINIKC